MNIKCIKGKQCYIAYFIITHTRCLLDDINLYNIDTNLN